ncbi:hypothetical protein JMJ77_0008583 [Colletotrichum scovillei]|uniref:Uncharacterized protein n=1 Tax=Colletotrichum scovillei TaxID=1209932 RepID=A0A9P7REF8_9PEZI|nr:hypothetical protein JMJ77_0008583 [Colletotrichum scovillei]KAG7075575.1 hypothetical protein JMJ76_0012035 [Colletotrichum scovillei]KAG7082623.1 hypothetical protein JMJ78_0004724 [Colletotrichum scovillei]
MDGLPVSNEAERVNHVLPLFRVYFGEELVDEFRRQRETDENDVMTRMFKAAGDGQLDGLLRNILYKHGVSDKYHVPDWMRRAAKQLHRLADGSSLRKWKRSRRRKARDTIGRRLAKAELFRMTFSSSEWEAGLQRQPLSYLGVYQHLYDLRQGNPSAAFDAVLDDQLRWGFRANYLVANIAELRRLWPTNGNCFVFSFRNWRCVGSRTMHMIRMQQYRVLTSYIRCTTIFPKRHMVAEGTRKDKYTGLAGRAMTYIVTRIIDACIPEHEWPSMLLQMQALVDRLEETHKDRRICEIRDLLSN